MIGIKLLYIRKKDITKNWSDVLDRQYEDLKKISELRDGNILLLEIDTSRIWAYLKSASQINQYLKKNNIQVIYVNHIICSYACLLVPFFHNRSLLKIIALHESEPVLGWNFAWKNLKHFAFKVLIRYTRLFHIPLYFFNKILILNRKQAEVYSKRFDFVQSNFLGIDSESFKPLTEENSTKIKVTLFFPHNPDRFEKGYENFKNAVSLLSSDSYEVLVGGNYSQSEIIEAYRKADIIYLTGYYETYSLVMLEAMANNKFIIANKEIGIVDNLLQKYSIEELESFGIFLASQNPEDICKRTEELFFKIHKGRNATTRTLLLKEGLDEKSANMRLYKLLETCNANFKIKQS